MERGYAMDCKPYEIEYIPTQLRMIDPSWMIRTYLRNRTWQLEIKVAVI